MKLLSTEELTMRFGGVTALQDVSLGIEAGGIFGLIGPNGSGKSTFFKCITGVLKPTSGRIGFQGEEITGKLPHEINRSGIALTFQQNTVFTNLTVLENVLVAQRRQGGWVSLAANRAAREEALNLLSLFGLVEKRNQMGEDLAFGEMRRLEIARSVATRPRLLLLDEPAAGLNPSETELLAQDIVTVSEKLDCTVILVEHDMSMVMKVCHHLAVLNFGRVIAEGSAEEVAANPDVIEAYLGRD